MEDPSIDKREQYVAFATHCLQLAKIAPDRQSRAVLKRDGCGVAKAGGRHQPIPRAAGTCMENCAWEG